MNRRKFLRDASVVTAGMATYSAFGFTQDAALKATITVDKATTLAAVPLDFTGLSYETAQLTNPAFFSPENKELVALIRGLGAQGILRIGGSTSGFSNFTETEPVQPAGNETANPATSKVKETDYKIGPKALENLRAFLDVTGWTCIYGLNLARGTKEVAALEASYVQRILGPKLVCMQLGNEPDAWRTRYRGENYWYPDYFKEWMAMREAVIAKVPNVKLAGPDISNKVVYFTGFAADAPKSAPEVMLLTGHYYRMGPAGAPDVNMDKLMTPDPWFEKDFPVLMKASKDAKLPYRMAEGNSCWNGGQAGISDAYASALWGADTMLTFMAGGCVGMNLHGGGKGNYAPIVGSKSEGFTKRPLYYGMQMAEQFAGATLVKTTVECSSDRVRAFAGMKDGAPMLIVINKSDTSVDVTMDAGLRKQAKHGWMLSGPSLESKTGTALEPVAVKTVLTKDGLHLGPHCAVLLRG